MLELARANGSPGIARRRVVERFASELDNLEVRKAGLLVSELVTNAVIHGRGRIELHADLDQERLRVEVIDEGPGFTTTFREPDLNTPGGHGLRIVEAEASKWGIREGTARVWFELRRHTPR